jgi:hypothetical protein
MDKDVLQNARRGGSPEIQRAAFGFTIERAGIDESTGQYRVTGIANTFKVMHSRRRRHPRGFQTWLKPTRGEATHQPGRPGR